MRFGARPLVFALVTLLALATGGTTAEAVVVDIPASKDNTLYDNNSPLSNGAGDHFFAGITQSRKIRRGVIAFDVAAAIPAGSTINSVTLTLYMSRTTAPDETVNLHRLLADWGEGTSQATGEEGGGASPATGDATWEHTFFDTDFWISPGGDFDAIPSASQTVGMALGYYAWTAPDMITDVQGWLDSPGTSFGWILIGRETDRRSAKRFDSRTNPVVAQRPVLTVDYTPVGSPTGSCCTGSTCQIVSAADCATLGGVYNGDGTPCTPNPCVEPSGACCADDGTCSEADQSVCEAGGGIFQGDGSTCAATECPINLTPYVDLLPIPPLAIPTVGSPGGTATYDMAIRETQQSFHTDLPPTTVWGYDDGTGTRYPGPTFFNTTGQPITVNWLNDLRETATGNLRTDHVLPVDTACIHGAANDARTVTHLHGGHVEQFSDGYPEFTWDPGLGETYDYPNNQHASTIWYHDHALGITRLNVMMGLAGFYVITDAVEQALNLPTGEFDVGLAIQDRKFNPDGSLNYPATWTDHWVGDKIVVNGKVWPRMEVKQGKYRFRILNGSSSRFYTLSLNPPTGTLDFTVIGSGGGLLEAPVFNQPTLTLGPGERYEVIVDFEGIPAGQSVYLENSAPAQFPNGTNDIVDVMRFDVLAEAGDTDPVPTTLRTIERLQEADAVMTRDFRLRKGAPDACGKSPWLINDLGWDDITEYPELDTVEIWRFINDSGVSHPMHMHLVFFQVLDRDTFTVGLGGEIIPDNNPQPPLPQETGWKDTAVVGPGEILRVIARFEDYKGRYAYHCHILEHEDHEMMRQFQTVRCGDAELDPTEACDDGGKVPADGCSADCEDEEFVVLGGSAAGDGGVSVVVAGQTITVNPTAGMTAAEVAAALAAAINADPGLAALGITALTSDGKLVVNAPVEDVLIGDGGIVE
ncbi:MAG: multicopper oxidase domain-containing protein, partial [Acidobacteriota bacterium]